MAPQVCLGTLVSFATISLILRIWKIFDWTHKVSGVMMTILWRSFSPYRYICCVLLYTVSGIVSVFVSVMMGTITLKLLNGEKHVTLLEHYLPEDTHQVILMYLSSVFGCAIIFFCCDTLYTVHIPLLLLYESDEIQPLRDLERTSRIINEIDMLSEEIVKLQNAL